MATLFGYTEIEPYDPKLVIAAMAAPVFRRPTCYPALAHRATKVVAALWLAVRESARLILGEMPSSAYSLQIDVLYYPVFW